MLIRNNYDRLMTSFSMMNRNHKNQSKSTHSQLNSYYIPVGCAACGGPYPYCKTSCPMFDD